MQLHHSSPALSVPPSGVAWAGRGLDLHRDFLAPLSEGDYDAAVSVFADDCLFLFPGLRPVRGRHMMRGVLAALRRRFSRIAWRPLVTLASGDDWMVVSTVADGLLLDGSTYRNEGVSIVRFDDRGAVVYLSEYLKDTSVFSLPSKVALC